MVILFGDGILGRKPQVLFRVHRIIKAGSRKACDGLFCIVDSLKDSCAVKVMDELTDFAAILRRVNQLRLSLSGYLDLHILIHVPIGVTRNGDRLRPVRHIGDNPPDQNGGTEHGSVQNGTDGPVRAFPHFL